MYQFYWNKRAKTLEGGERKKKKKKKKKTKIGKDQRNRGGVGGIVRWWPWWEMQKRKNKKIKGNGLDWIEETEKIKGQKKSDRFMFGVTNGYGWGLWLSLIGGRDFFR